MPNIIVPHSQEKDLYKIVSAVRQLAEVVQPMRSVRTSNATYYVATTGSDTANDGLSSASPFLTIPKAVNTISALDLSIYAATINVAAGTYADAVTLKSYLGVGPVTIAGSGSATCTISTTANDCFAGNGVSGRYVLTGMKVTAATSGYGIHIQNGTAVDFSDIDFGTMGGAAIGYAHAVARSYSNLTCVGNYKISGGGYIHLQAFTASILVSTKTITVSNSPAFTYFVYSTDQSNIYMPRNTWSGAVGSGLAFGADGLSLINTLADVDHSIASAFPSGVSFPGYQANGGLIK